MKHFISILLLSGKVFGTTTVCVRNYIASGYDACEKTPFGYTYVIPADASIPKICTRVYSDFYCENAPREYKHIPTLQGEEICTLDYNQPNVVNYCESVPHLYKYADAGE